MSTKVNPEMVRHIATLARLKLSDEEIESFASELSAIIGYVDQLSEVDVEGVEPTAHAVDVRNVLREDVEGQSVGQDTSVSNAPDKQDGFFKVPKVLDQDSV